MDRKPGHLTQNPQDSVANLVWVKVVGIGHPAVGKTCLIKHFCESKFNQGYQPTVGVDYGFKIQGIQGANLRVHLWDLSGSAEYVDVRNELYTNTDAIFLVYDVTNDASFEGLDGWLKEVNKNCTTQPDIFLVGNKVDQKLKRTIALADAKKWAKDHRLWYFETSASTGEGVDKLFSDILTMVHEKRKSTPEA